MFPPGARDAKTTRSKRCRIETGRHDIAGLVDADPAKALVMTHLHRLVVDGHAEWDRRDNGDIHLRLQTGEAFLLAHTTITRIA
jgi:hypothetical protein